MRQVCVLTVVCVVGILSCSRLSPTGPDPATPEATLIGAGDIGECASEGPSLTAALLGGNGETVFTAGDNAYENGTPEEYERCYAHFWGRFLSRTRPSPGNHDYFSSGAAPYFAYFGEQAGPPGLWYYSYDLATWHVVSLNSNIPSGPGSPQAQWLRADLRANQKPCMLAYWHHPVFSLGPNGNSDIIREIWRVLYEYRASVVISGHDHIYERFLPQTPDGIADPDRGIRQFVVGTGGGRRCTAQRANSRTAKS